MFKKRSARLRKIPKGMAHRLNSDSYKPNVDIITGPLLRNHSENVASSVREMHLKWQTLPPAAVNRIVSVEEQKRY